MVPKMAPKLWKTKTYNPDDIEVVVRLCTSLWMNSSLLALLINEGTYMCALGPPWARAGLGKLL